MRIIKGLTRLGVVLASLGVIAAAFAGTAQASVARIPLPDNGGGDAGTAITPPSVVHTVVVGGMAGWQIAVIAIAAALVAAVAAVLADRARSARRRLLSNSA